LSEVFSQAVNSVLTLFFMGLVGYCLAKLGLVSKAVKDFFPFMVVRVTLPLFLLSTTVKHYSRHDLISLVPWVGLGCISVFLTFGVAILVSRVIRPQGRRQGIYCAAFTASNTMYIGIPINLALFGEQALGPAMTYFLANGLFFWTLGNYYMSLDGKVGRVPILSLDTLKRLMPPPMVGFAAGIILVLLDLKLPDFILNATTSIGAMNTPLAIMYIGLGFCGLSFSKLGPAKEIISVLSGRFLICPLITLAACLLVQAPVLTTQVFVIQSSLPVLAAASIMAGYYQSDQDYASLLVSLSTILSLVTIPAFRVLISFL
jgi:predicted permease